MARYEVECTKCCYHETISMSFAEFDHFKSHWGWMPNHLNARCPLCEVWHTVRVKPMGVNIQVSNLATI